LVQRRRQSFWVVVTSGFFSADGALTCICGCYGDTMIPGGVPEPRQGFPGQNQVCFNAELPEGLKVTETFPDSLNL